MAEAPAGRVPRSTLTRRSPLALPAVTSPWLVVTEPSWRVVCAPGASSNTTAVASAVPRFRRASVYRIERGERASWCGSPAGSTVPCRASRKSAASVASRRGRAPTTTREGSPDSGVAGSSLSTPGPAPKTSPWTAICATEGGRGFSTSAAKVIVARPRPPSPPRSTRTAVSSTPLPEATLPWVVVTVPVRSRAWRTGGWTNTSPGDSKAPSLRAITVHRSVSPPPTPGPAAPPVPAQVMVRPRPPDRPPRASGACAPRREGPSTCAAATAGRRTQTSRCNRRRATGAPPLMTLWTGPESIHGRSAGRQSPAQSSSRRRRTQASMIS